MRNPLTTEALERRRAQNRIAQKRHRQRRAQLEQEQLKRQKDLRERAEVNNESYEHGRGCTKTPARRNTATHKEPPSPPHSTHSNHDCPHCSCGELQKSASQQDSTLDHMSSDAFDLGSTELDGLNSFPTRYSDLAIPSTATNATVLLPSADQTALPDLNTNLDLSYLDYPEYHDDAFMTSSILMPSPTSTISLQDIPPTQGETAMRINKADRAPPGPRTGVRRDRPRSIFSLTSPASRYSVPISDFTKRRMTSPAVSYFSTSRQRPPIQSASVSHTGKTALHLCVEKGNLKMVTFLLSRGAAIDYQDDHGRTALHYACQSSHIDIVRRLLEQGADIGLGDCEGFTPLHVAADVGSEEVIALLTLEGADLNCRIGMDESQEVDEDDTL